MPLNGQKWHIPTPFNNQMPRWSWEVERYMHRLEKTLLRKSETRRPDPQTPCKHWLKWETNLDRAQFEGTLTKQRHPGNLEEIA